nr:alpha/beta hydrolase [Mesorhizobium sp.]
MNAATACVFAPNKVPDFYVAEVAIPLVLRPNAFRANATDVAGLYRYTLDAAPHYRDIKAPTVVISGDRDKVVYATIHSVGLVRDIAGAELVWVRNLGHKPDWIAPDVVVGAIEKVAGRDVDLQVWRRPWKSGLPATPTVPANAPTSKPRTPNSRQFRATEIIRSDGQA